MDNSYDLIEGHYPYGIHHICRIEKPKYVVMLRDPIDRAISNYYFIRQAIGPNYVHPRIEEARQNSIIEFYKKPKNQNIQTRFIAGFLWEYAGRFISFNNKAGKIITKKAKYNLINEYISFGIKEEYKKSKKIISKKLNLKYESHEDEYRTTDKRPKLDNLESAKRKLLKESNMLDVELYSFAKENFESGQE